MAVNVGTEESFHSQPIHTTDMNPVAAVCIARGPRFFTTVEAAVWKAHLSTTVAAVWKAPSKAPYNDPLPDVCMVQGTL